MIVRIFLILVAISIASSGFSKSKKPPTNEGAGQASPEQRSTDEISLAVKIAPAQAPEEKAENKRHDEEKIIIDRKLAFETQRIADYTDNLSHFTLLLLMVAAAQAGLFVIQLRLMKRSIDDAKEGFIADKRVWIQIKSVKLVHPTKFSDDSMVFRIEVQTENIGNTPAMNVDIKIESVYFEEGGGAKFRDAEDKFIKRLRNHPIELGETVFPKDTLDLRLL